MRPIALAPSLLLFALSLLPLLILMGAAPPPAAAAPLAYYLPAGVEHDPAIPRPEETLGFEVGEQHVRPDQLLAYMEELAESSPRVRLEIQGRTHESRPLPLLTITSPANLERLEELRLAHLAAADPAREELGEDELAALPTVVWLGYSVHGDEASGSNAALLGAYHLAAGRGEAVERLLEKTIVLLDPSLNPDGLARFAQWATMHRGKVPIASREHREHRQGWPSGRTNHYWFDLNRDWMPAQHPESQARLETYHRWWPHLMGDYHEMGSDSTYFFQPGVPSRANPFIPAENQRLTRVVAGYHAAALDRAGVLYYSEESFDDFYPGKGSTYPDLTGSIGVLFEQASARGRLLETERGMIDFPFTIRNQFLTSLSMLEAASEQRRALIDYRRDFARSALEEAERDATAFYLAALPSDRARAQHLLELLGRHRIEVRPLLRTVEIGDESFEPGRAWAIPVRQGGYRLIKALFDTRREFDDSTFYDVSAWTLPLAFDARWAALDLKQASRLEIGEALGAPLAAPVLEFGRFSADPQAIAYAFSWSGYYAPRALARLFVAGVGAQVATRGLVAESGGATVRLAPGAVVVPASGLARSARSDGREAIEAVLAQAAELDGVDVLALTGGLTLEGEDLGSPTMRPLEAPQPLLVVGEGVDAYEAGALWHLLDHRFSLPVALVEKPRLKTMDLAPFTHVLLPEGDYEDLGPEAREAIERWVRAGGVIVASGRAARWAGVELFAESSDSAAPAESAEQGPQPEPTDALASVPKAQQIEKGAGQRYADYEKARQAQVVSGAVFELSLDTTHPLGFGFDDETLPLLHRGVESLADTGNPWETVALFSPAPLLAGYAPAAAVEALAGTPAVTLQRIDDGALVRFADSPAFRGFWFGAHKLILNALFFARAVDPTPLEPKMSQ